MAAERAAGPGAVALREDTAFCAWCQSGLWHKEVLGPSPGALEGRGGAFWGDGGTG